VKIGLSVAGKFKRNMSRTLRLPYQAMAAGKARYGG
jgi:hypothetical protein